PYATCAAFSPDGEYVALGNSTEVLIRNTKDGQAVVRYRGRFPYPRLASRLAFSPGGQWLAIHLGQPLPVAQSPVSLLNALPRDTLLLRGAARADGVVFSHDGNRLVCVGSPWGAGGGRADVWNVETGKLLCSIGEPNERVMGCSFSPDCK